MYHIFKKEGVKIIIHAGDISDGYGVYRGQEFEVKCPGQDEQVEYVVKNYPKIKGLDTFFITGNHDLRMYEKGGIDIGHSISQQRKDLHYLGQVTAKVIMADDTTMEILHPDGSCSMALSYKAQPDNKQLSKRPSA